MKRKSSKCRVCGVVLNDDNWYLQFQNQGTRICKKCNIKDVQSWQRNNPEKNKANSTKQNRKKGHQPIDENKQCSSFLGVYVAERMLSKVFKGVERMPYGNKGYDFVCNNGYKIDVKSSCKRKNGRWEFSIHRNGIADYFLCVAYDNREDMNPIHLWLIPSNKISHLTGIAISPTTVNKWKEYELGIDKAIKCCDRMRN